MSDNLSNIDVALYALYKLGGASKKIHTEHIAFEAYELSEERFAWSLPEYRKHGFPDKTTVRYALESAKKEKLIKGRAGRDKGGKESEGWQFTPKGVEWFLKNEKRIQENIKTEKPLSLIMPKVQAERFIKKIHTEKLFLLFRDKKALENATVYDFADLVNCSPDATKGIMRQKFDLLKNTAIAINEEEIKSFFSECENKFKDILRTEDTL